jgi:putative tryptophan/tyrosine transport system substrate-binding protein
MKRRQFISLLGGAAAAWPLAAAGSVTLVFPAMAQQPGKVPRVGILTPAENDATPIFDAFRKGLRDLGYVDGKTIVLDFRFAKGHFDSLPGLAAELLRIPVDVIVADGTTAARVVTDITNKIPIVVPAGGDPVALGLAASIARPGGNVTGFSIRVDELSGKRLELLRQAYPNTTRVTVLLDPTITFTQQILRATEKAATTLGIELATLAASTPEELHALGTAVLAGSGLVVFPGAMFWNHRTSIVALAAAARVPAIYPERDYADVGGLIAYGPNIPDNFRRAAGYVDRILRGAKPADLPIEEASKFGFIERARKDRLNRMRCETRHLRPGFKRVRFVRRVGPSRLQATSAVSYQSLCNPIVPVEGKLRNKSGLQGGQTKYYFAKSLARRRWVTATMS